MKKLILTSALAAVLVLSQSFTANTVADKNAPGLNLFIDASPFDAVSGNNYTAQLTNDAKTVSLTFKGNGTYDKAGNIQANKIQLDYTLRDGALGDVNVTKGSYEYNGQKYNVLPGTAFVSITKMKWNADHKSFVINADIFCKVQKSFVMEEFVPIFVIRGSVQNLTVNVPVS